ncbi:MAG: IS30 family transposase [Lachnospiraceae bacterium]|nr:IS30 family transposase [Corallococcus sp.]MCM1221415.1 IS30 family transposase [Lachnospiraceae bacterium]
MYKSKNKFKYLTWTQRLQIEAYMRTKTPIKQIAELIGVHYSTVYRELKRGQYEKKTQRLDYVDYKVKYKTTYSPDIAQKHFEYNQTNKGCPIKLGKDYKLAEYIETRIVKNKLSPLAVLGEIRRKQLQFDTSICVTTLYSYIRKGVFLTLSMEHIAQRKQTKDKVRAKRPPRGTSIERRPLEINKRQTFGHWEMDCVCGPTKDVLLTLSERLTRNEIIFQMPNQQADSVVRCLNKLEYKYGKLFRKVFKTITVDNGSEFQNYDGMQRSIYKGRRTTVYYCHPYSSSERGTNERLNREIRRLIPKGTDLSQYSRDDISAVQDWVNNYPRQVLNFATSQELFDEQIKLLVQ